MSNQQILCRYTSERLDLLGYSRKPVPARDFVALGSPDEYFPQNLPLQYSLPLVRPDAESFLSRCHQEASIPHSDQ
jgi:hypothetical protein